MTSSSRRPRGHDGASADITFDPHVIFEVRRHAGVTRDLVFVSVNHAAIDALRLAPGEVLGQPLSALASEFFNSPIGEQLLAVADNGATLERHDIELATRSGQRRRFDLLAVAVEEGVSLTWRETTDQSNLAHRFHLLAHYASDVVFETDDQGVLTWISPGAEPIFGVSAESLVGHNVAEYVEVLEEVDPSMVKPGVHRTVRAIITHSDGTRTTMAATFQLFRDDDRGVDTIIGSAHVIDDLVEARERLELYAHRYELLAKYSSDVIVVTDNDGIIEWIFDGVLGMLGWNPEELVGHRSEEFVHPEDCSRILESRARARAGESTSPEVRFLRRDGSFRWITTTGRDVLDEHGRFAHRIVSWRVADEEVASRQAVEASEARFRLVAENASDVVLLTDDEEFITWVSPSVTRVLGWAPEEMIGHLVTEFNSPEDVSDRLEARRRLHQGAERDSFEGRYRARDGGYRWMSVLYRVLYDQSRGVNSVVASLRDISDVVTEQRAHAVLAAGNAALVGALDEIQLLGQLCENIVQHGGYRFAWYGRPEDDEFQSVSVVAASKQHHEYLDGVAISWGERPEGRGPVGTAMRTLEVAVENDTQRSTSFAPWTQSAARHGFASVIALPVSLEGKLDGVFSVYDSETNSFSAANVVKFEEFAAQVSIGLQRIRERIELRVAQRESALLARAIDHSVEAVVITDLDARILFANPATLEMTGYGLDELMGQTLEVFASGTHDIAFFEQLWARLREKDTWQGVITNRRRDGRVFDVDATIASVRDANGDTFAYVSVQRDLSHEQGLESALRQAMDDTAAVSAVMGDLPDEPSVEVAASTLCRRVGRLPFVASVALYARSTSDAMTCVANSGSMHPGVRPGLAFPMANLEDFLSRIAAGTWVINLDNPGEFSDSPLVDFMRDHGVGTAVMMPVNYGGVLVGILATTEPSNARADASNVRRAAYDNLSGFASTWLGPALATKSKTRLTRERIHGLIEHQAFHPVFQPIIDLHTGAVVGYEALTRFSEGTRPDIVFAEADAVGLGADLELSCMGAALRASVDLPRGAWVSVNLSPTTIGHQDVAALRRLTERRVALEITEHARVADFAAVRRAVGALTDSLLVVDDAGAGYAGLSHILELHPDLVKLDISVIRGINRDVARQAMVAGMRHFTRLAHAQLLAEGIETAEEAASVRDLGVDLAQGYFFGRPAPAASFH